MTRDEALEIQCTGSTCYYTGTILNFLKYKPLYIRELTYAFSKLQAARVSTTQSASINPTGVAEGDITSTWIKLEELAISVNN